jgi:hypothetical protein
MFDPASTTPQPPRKLGDHGLSLWDGIQSEYKIDDTAGREMLAQACEAADRVARLAEKINADGEIIQTAAGLKAHPLLTNELANRAFICRTLRQLGLSLEPTRLVGRPTAWRKQQEARDAEN